MSQQNSALPAVCSIDQSGADKATLRKQIRQQIRQARQHLSPDDQQLSALQLMQQAQQLAELRHAQHIALYLSNDGELDTAPLLNYLQSLGKNLYLPVLHPFAAGYLLFQRYTDETALHLNKFGIPEPKPDCSAIRLVAELDLILMPLVAFDARGHRLGMGGGFYDRTLAAQSVQRGTVAKSAPLLVGISHQCQQVSAIPAEPWDVPLSVVLTPQQIWRFGG